MLSQDLYMILCHYISMPPRRRDKIRFDMIVGAEPYTFIDLVPPDQHGDFLFRAAHVGGLVLNVVHGRNILNRGGDRLGWNAQKLEVHVAATHGSACSFAKAMSAFRTDPVQFREGDACEFERLAGLQASGIPGLVLGLPRAVYESRLQESRFGIGWTLNEEVPIANIDPFSREYLEHVCRTQFVV